MSPLNLGSQGQECAGRDEYVRRFQDMDTDASKSIDFDEMLAYYQPWLKPAAAGPGPVGAERGIRSLLENQREKLHAEPPQEGPAGADAYTSPQLAVPPAGSAGFAGAANAGRGPCPSGGNTTGVGSVRAEVLAPAEGAADGLLLEEVAEGVLLEEAQMGAAKAMLLQQPAEGAAEEMLLHEAQMAALTLLQVSHAAQYAYMYMYSCICICICMHVCMYACMHACMYVCNACYMWIYGCMYECNVCNVM